MNKCANRPDIVKLLSDYLTVYGQFIISSLFVPVYANSVWERFFLVVE
jgi:hypothetical protein